MSPIAKFEQLSPDILNDYLLPMTPQDTWSPRAAGSSFGGSALSAWLEGSGAAVKEEGMTLLAAAATPAGTASMAGGTTMPAAARTIEVN